MKKTILGFAALVLIASVSFGCGESKPDPNDPNSRQNVLKGNEAPASGGAGATGGSRVLTPTVNNPPPPPPPK